jgi:hypothetical protein
MSQYRKELLSPSGDRYVSTSARETNDLIYGSGYRDADESTAKPDKADVDTDKGAPANPFAFGGEVRP